MNNRTIPADSAVLSAKTADFQDLGSYGMDRAIGVEKASLKEKTSWFAPLLGFLVQAVVQTIGACMESQRRWLTPRVPRAGSHVGTVASNSGAQAHPTAEVLASSMDIAIGVQHVAAPVRMVASSSRGKTQPQPQPTPDELAYSMDIAIGERFTVLSRTVESIPGSQSPTAEVPESSRDLAMAATAGS